MDDDSDPWDFAEQAYEEWREEILEEAVNLHAIEKDQQLGTR